jgi:DNA polymerase-3 subunit epsilon
LPGGSFTGVDWLDRPLAAFDLETTGTDPEEDRIVTASVALVGAGLEPEAVDWLVDPGIEIPESATRVHKITTEMARTEGRKPDEAVDEITRLLAAYVNEDYPIVAFNARYDLTMLDRESRRHGIEPLVELVGDSGLLVIDPMILDKQQDPYRRGKRKLTDVCAVYGVELTEAHAAHADALAAARLAWRLGKSNPEFGSLDLPTLHEQQIEWARTQAEGLQKYFDEQGLDRVVEAEWPLVPLPG